MRHIKIAAAALALGVALTGCSTLNRQEHHACLVTDKTVLYTTVDGNSSRTKRLDTSCGSFNVTDSIGAGWQSWDIWQQLHVGQTYDITTGGYRFAGMFPTVVRVHRVESRIV
ncbi:hypothetical protein ABW16_01895 [Mycolicibacter heraklionensis]|uniref:Lipoprotein n=1 Tax=Mycolicibacter heraklionensis TaxID=512402 RepID=A0ABR5FL31_9MYCO|nr:hypothetical protein [Mycolicibacter heraklionensis]KLO31604.1 hypothetical protein ABW16_01895 [Mycolicibacter heraklionensis]